MSEYHEPESELTEEVRDVHRAVTSLKEELEAVDWYNQRWAASKNKGLRAVLAHNRDEEIEHACMTLEWLRRIFIVPVFTAHPTEVARRSVMFKRRRISELLEQLDRIPISDEELEHLQQQLTAEITALWQTDEVRSRKPTVYDEIQMGLDFYGSSLFATLTPLYQEIADALRCEYDLNIEVADLPLEDRPLARGPQAAVDDAFGVRRIPYRLHRRYQRIGIATE